MDYLILILPLIGVILGGAIGLLSPWLSYQLEKRKRKASIKYELIQSLTTLCGTYKEQAHSSNWLNVSKLSQQYTLSQIANAPDERTSSIYKADRDTIQTDIFKLLDKGERVYSKLVDVESKINSLLSEINEYYGKEDYKSIKSFLKPTIDRINDYDKLFLFDYDKFTKSDALTLEKKLPEKLKANSIEIQEKLDELIDEINTTLK